jgi:hypothetical protein
MVFATGNDCYVNDKKVARIYPDYYLEAITPSYQGQNILMGWKIYDVNENLILTIGVNEDFIPESEGKYYLVAIFADPINY